MIDLKLAQILEAVDGVLISLDKTKSIEITINDIEIDSRKTLEGKLFVAINGEKFDGHDFIEEAYKKGAVCCITEKDLNTEHTYIKVSNTKQALIDIAEYYRNLFDIKVVAITGSSGKTTTKDIIASVLEQKYNVLKTSGNFNNEIGLPLTIFKLDHTIQVAVLEMGMNHAGEISNLSKIAKPDICVITNIGVSHIEYLGSREAIFKAKTEIFDFIKKDGKKILCGEDDLLKSLSGDKNIIYYGTDRDSNFYADNITYNGLYGSDFDIINADNKINIKLNKVGKHMILNSLAAAAVGVSLNLDNSQIKNGIENFETSGMRMEIVKTNKYTILNDVYNANPESMKVALDVLSNLEGTKICILGDMLELGDHSEELHYSIGQYAYEKELDIVVCIGDRAFSIYEGVYDLLMKDDPQNKQAIYFEDQNNALDKLDKFLEKGDTVLVKASRGMHFEKIVERLLSR